MPETVPTPTPLTLIGTIVDDTVINDGPVPLGPVPTAVPEPTASLQPTPAPAPAATPQTGEEIVIDDEVPLGSVEADKLPQTGESSPAPYYIAGLGIAGLGLLLSRRAGSSKRKR
ncbi:LPXTG cell wall anchor domain-containing protein [Paenibacillus sp. S150]|uniref:LPXTG cell wall anchor domain-containing protein n=1 Tax=Paenibacillus sp. S150 TaxID=2749826 RepID=UPI001C59C884|nr:LPXTG cell wall anchor domain-containing protein [Paenibacillus sp. S150]MBW4084205.1 LPXTG cell wall anchor domain-containing protein [Paenibacillus sp. S150]